jgi:glycosyltransferase involved in cell wall biosynthesis
MIVKDEEKNLARLLPSLIPVFDQVVIVDTGSSDSSVQIAKDLGAEVHFFPWNGSFSDARNYAFSKLDTDWLGWCDADDEWEGLDKVRFHVDNFDKNAPQVNAIWALYDYDQQVLGGKLVTTQLHRRERFVKRGGGWRWTRRIHEHMITDTPVALGVDEFIVHHRPDHAKGEARAKRNIQILRSSLKDDPLDARSWFDLGTQYFNQHQWARSLAMYRRYLRLQKQPLEAYQAHHRMADCYRHLNKIDQAEDHDWAAVRVKEEWTDAWDGLAQIAFAQGNFELALRRIDLALSAERPADYLVLNPLDYTLHPWVVKQRILAGMGRLEEALEWCNKAMTINPDHPELVFVKPMYEGILADRALAQKTVELAEKLSEDSRPSLFQALPERIQTNKDIRDILLAPIYNATWQPDAIFFCGPSLEDWGPESIHRTGIGGSETAVIHLAQALSARGMKVAIYNQCGFQETSTTLDGPRYFDYRRYNEEKKAKLFVGWRNPGIGKFAAKSDKRWLWLHDLHLGAEPSQEDIATFDLIRPVSAWHGQHLLGLYPWMDAQKIAPTRNGIDLNRFGLSDITVRDPMRAIYVSSPDRGLDNLLDIWPNIMQYVPDAELHIFYGWESYDKAMNQTRNATMLQFKNQIMAKTRQPGVIFRGRLNQHDLAHEMMRAQVLAYPTAFLETGFIGGMECQAAGTVVLSTRAGAISETMGDAGLLFWGHPSSDAYRTAFTKSLIALLKNPKAGENWTKRGYERAKTFGWDGVAQEWIKRIEGKTSDGNSRNGVVGKGNGPVLRLVDGRSSNGHPKRIKAKR